VSQSNGRPSNNFFQADAKLNAALEFLPQFQRLQSILRGGDLMKVCLRGGKIGAGASYESIIVTQRDPARKVSRGLEVVST
jgi:hypothetical protein